DPGSDRETSATSELDRPQPPAASPPTPSMATWKAAWSPLVMARQNPSASSLAAARNSARPCSHSGLSPEPQELRFRNTVFQISYQPSQEPHCPAPVGVAS